MVSDAQRALLLRRVVAEAVSGDATIGRSSRFAGFAETLAQTIAELESGLLEPSDLDGDLAALADIAHVGETVCHARADIGTG